MRLNRFNILAFGIVLCLTACGDQPKQGAQGPAGPQGAESKEPSDRKVLKELPVRKVRWVCRTGG